MRCYRRRTLVLGALLAATLLGPAPASAASSFPHGRIGLPAVVGRFSQQVLRLLDADRAASHVAPLALDTRLTRVAMAHSYDMAMHHYFSHDAAGVDPFQRFARNGIHFSVAAENLGLARGYTLSGAVVVINTDMMAEPLVAGSHHANIVNPQFSRVGIGLYLAPHNTVYLTEDFIN